MHRLRAATLDLLPAPGRIAPLNGWAVAIVVALLVQLGLELTADALNLRTLRTEPPAEFRAVFDGGRYRRTQEYVRTRTVFGIVTAVVDLLVVLGVWLSGTLAALDTAVRQLGFGPVGSGLVFLGALGLSWTILHVPFRWWSTFVIEARFGFNRTTPRTFWTDLAKGLLLAALLGGPLLAAILWLFATWGPPRAWLWCWVASAIYVVAVQFVAPVWIMPLFNRFTPLSPGALRDAILAYSRAVGFPLADVFVIDGSRRSSKGNALFTGFGRHRRVALFDTLLDKLAPDEVVAVVAHEVGHYKRHHVLQGMALGVAQLGVTFFLLSLTLRQQGLFDAFFLAPSVHAGLLVFALVLTPVEALLTIAINALSRHNEREADAFAVTTTGSGTALASGLTRLAADGLANLSPHPLHVLLHHSHPPVLERVRTLTRGP